MIRTMIESDIPKLANIISENYDKHCADMFYIEANCSFYSYPFKPRFIVIEYLNEPVGCACWNTDWCSWGIFNISWVQVKKDMQNKGIGKILIDGILSELLPLASLILLSTTKPDYYLRWGFKKLKLYKTTITTYDREEFETLMALEVVQ